MEGLGPYVFVLLMAASLLYLVGYVLVVTDMRKNYPDVFKELDGSTIFFRPMKQMDFLAWIMSRKYAKSSPGRFHRYDMFLATFVVFVLCFFALAVIHS